MTLELHLRFPQPEQFVIQFEDTESDRLDLTSPLAGKEHQDIRYRSNRRRINTGKDCII